MSLGEGNRNIAPDISFLMVERVTLIAKKLTGHEVQGGQPKILGHS